MNILGYFREVHKQFQMTRILRFSGVVSFVVLALVSYDIPEKAIHPMPDQMRMWFLLLMLLVFATVLIQLKVRTAIKLPFVHEADAVILFMVFLCTILFLMSLISYRLEKVQTVVLLCLVLFSMALLFFRIHKCAQKNGNSVQELSVDLKELYEGNVCLEKGTALLFSEKEVDYDLLLRDGIIDELCRMITGYRSDTSFVIALDGEWGSGKTTIINNVKRRLRDKKNAIVISDIDMWLYGSEESFLEALFEAILQETGYNHGKRTFRNMSQILIKTVSTAGTTGSVIGSVLGDRKTPEEEVAVLKRRLSSYLRKSNRAHVFMIDNIDRASPENIIFLFKLLGTIFELPNLVFILAYDKKRIQNAFQSNRQTDPNYADKIVQCEIRVPSAPKERLGFIYASCLEKILLHYGVPTEEMVSYRTFYALIDTHVADLRTFKRLINSAFPPVFTIDHGLDQPQLLILEVIRFLVPDLYDWIHRSAYYLVSENREAERIIGFRFPNRAQFNKEGKAFFEELFAKHHTYKDVLIALFPYAERADKKEDLMPEYPAPKEATVERDRRNIRDGKYFDLYFSFGGNHYTELGDDAEKLIHAVKESMSPEEIRRHIRTNIRSLDKTDQNEWLWQLERCMTDLKSETIMRIVAALFEEIKCFADTQEFLSLSPSRRAAYLIADKLKSADTGDIHRFIEEHMEAYDKLYLIGDILSWIQDKGYSEYDSDNDIKHVLEEWQKTLGQKICDNKINLFEDRHYARYNIWGLKQAIGETGQNAEKTGTYIAKYALPFHIYRLLWDIVQTGTGNHGYIYQFTDEVLSAVGINQNIINDALEHYPPQKDDEIFIKRVYTVYRDGTKDSWGQCRVVTGKEQLPQESFIDAGGGE